MHIDQKSDIAPFRNAIRSERATLLDERLPIEWGGWNMVQATLDLLRRAHQREPEHPLSTSVGRCYPIKSNQEIAAKLGSGNVNYITINEQMKPCSRYHDRLVYRRSDMELIKSLNRRRSLARLNIPTHVSRFIRQRVANRTA